MHVFHGVAAAERARRWFWRLNARHVESRGFVGGSGHVRYTRTNVSAASSASDAECMGSIDSEVNTVKTIEESTSRFIMSSAAIT